MFHVAVHRLGGLPTAAVLDVAAGFAGQRVQRGPAMSKTMWAHSAPFQLQVGMPLLAGLAHLIVCQVEQPFLGKGTAPQG